MASWDFEKAAKIITSSPNPILDALAVQYGVPNCLLDMAKNVLSAFPSPALTQMNSGVQEGKRLANSVFKDIMRKIFLDTGIIEYDTTLGKFVFVSSSSNLGVEDNALQGINNLFGLGTIIGFGAQAMMIGQAGKAFTDKIKRCIDAMKSFQALQKGSSAVADKMVGFSVTDPNDPTKSIKFEPPPPGEAASLVFDQNKETLESAVGFITSCKLFQQNVSEILQQRQEDPENYPEPVFDATAEPEDPNSPWAGQTLGEALSGLTTFNIADPKDLNCSWIAPQGSEPGYWKCEGEPDPTKSPFADIITPFETLPPVAKKGKFLYSRTGLYYDSYSGGIPYEGCLSNIVSAIYYDKDGNPRPGAGVPPGAVKWLHDYNPNIGGKGTCLSWNTFNELTETIFDLNNINESPEIKQFYDEDHFLQVLIDERNREVYDLSSYITELQLSGYTEDTAILSNQRQTLYSKISGHDSKIKRRKKQIEVHVVLAPAGNEAKPGQIPINDFKTLDIGPIVAPKSKQEDLLFHQYEVSSVVLPLCPTLIKSQVTEGGFNINSLMIPPVGVGSIIASDPYVSGTSGTVLSLNDQITTNGLVAIYNFLDSDLVSPDSTQYLTINCSTSSTVSGAAQMVASSVDSMFPSGIGLPYFRGICNFFSGVSGDGNTKTAWVQNLEASARYLHDAYRPYGYARIESGWNDIDSLFYASGGATIESWVHMPDLHDRAGPGWNTEGSLSALHRVMLGCENRGGKFLSNDPHLTVGPQYEDSVRGMLMGFTRDRRITKGMLPSNNPVDNEVSSGLSFYLAPTQSVNTSTVTFVTPSADAFYCAQDATAPSGAYGFSIDTSTTVSGVTLDSLSSSFMLLTLSIDYGGDAVSLYLNGNLMKTQNIHSVFGTLGGKGVPPRLPSMADTSAFNYDVIYEKELDQMAPRYPVNSLGWSDFWSWDGPVPLGGARSSRITPFIIGGGYTDGMHPKSLTEDGNTLTYDTNSAAGMNFLGGQWGGKKSGLYGFLGSFKLYKRAISEGEALVNYNAQKGFFENIRI